LGDTESPIGVLQKRLASHRRGQQGIDFCRNVHAQRRLFALWKLSRRRSPSFSQFEIASDCNVTDTHQRAGDFDTVSFCSQHIALPAKMDFS
jgi:hypothetical protein